MKLIIQVPCFNEELTLAETIADLPRQIPGIDVIEYLVIDDGSSDRTVEVARECGVHHVVRHSRNRGLARAFMTGLEASLRAGADVIVNTDADNQYQGADIPEIVAPIVSGEADLVVGTRPINSIKTFSPAKRVLQRMGTHVVRVLSGTEVRDATSGFRAFSRETALRLQVYGRYTYTLETLIQAGADGMKVIPVPIRVNPQTRPSRLVKSSFDYVRKSIPTILRSYARYRPLKFFTSLSLIPGIAGVALLVRWFILRATGDDSSRVPSLVGAAILMVFAAQVFALGIFADIQSVQRRMTSELLVHARRSALDATALSPESTSGPAPVSSAQPSPVDAR